ncbi:MAG: T9SS type A sorting domain-containing protein [Flavobacteriaceae bacterium]
MKKIILTLGVLFFGLTLYAQNDKGAKVVIASQAIQKNGFSIQVGLPFLGTKNSGRITNPVDIRFPWDVLYLFQTFSEESFNISKGYFGDKILINWNLRSNFDKINSIKIYRRIFKEYANISEDLANKYEFVASVSKSVNSYEDQYVEGGILYEYKVVADGVSTIESRFTTFITGIGYRNPTAIVTGNVSFKGGNPVKNVIIVASSAGSGISSGSSLIVPATGVINIKALSTPISDAVTFQAWLKPKDKFTNDAATPIKLFQLSNLDINTIDVKVNLLATSKILLIDIGGSIYKLHNYFPSGKLNPRGDDILVPVTDFNDGFVHFTVVMEDAKIPLLYINGRAITTAYKDVANENLKDIDPNYTAPYFDVTIPTATNTLKIGGNPTIWDDIYIGGGNASFVDEIRIWKTVLEPATVRTDYTRFISGNDSRMVAYLRANEKVGAYAYDLSRSGFEFNKNDAKLWDNSTPTANKVLWDSSVGSFPAADQLGVLGVTDVNGNYEITAIPYSGTGESFNITPLFGQHQFEPSQQLVFLGQGAEVINKIDFVDISSFNFKGKILFDSRDVFKSFVQVNSGTSSSPIFSGLTDGDEYVSGPGILDEGYNFYKKNSEKFSKGEYWLNDNGTPSDTTDDYLERYARIPSDGVNIYVDGNIVLDENSVPVVSDVEGNFDVSVPIGNHYISIKKDGHEFTLNARFPEITGTFKEFFEDSNEQTIFIDATKVTVVGRVVGGAVQAQKVIGFGQDGLFEKSVVNSDGNNETITISSKNNIGQASLVFDYIPVGSSVTSFTKFNFTTNSESGEYRVKLLPLSYEINQTNGLKINSNTGINILEANETLNIIEAKPLIIPEFEYADGTKELGTGYNYIKSFIYRESPVLRVTNQTSDAELTIDAIKISTTGFQYPVYTQFSSYQIDLKSFERYINKDSGTAVEDLVPVIDGELIVTNNLALANTAKLVVNANDASILNYSFKAGLPAISLPFTKTIDIKYRVNGVDYPAEADSYIKEGIVLGGKSDGSQTFVTAAPNSPDIILRDPPGSNSFASIQSGESITLTTKNEFNNSTGTSQNFKLMLGVEFQAGGGLAGPVIKSENTNNVQVGIGVKKTSTDGQSVTKTYTFSQTISTSSDIEFVGAEGDLYIGQSKNYFYGSYDDIQTSNAIIGSSPSFELTNTDGVSIFVSKQKAMYFVEEPSNTFFAFSQKYILESLIPDLQLIISNLEDGVILETDPGVLTLAEYKQQVNLWRKTILENERSKYLVKNDRSTYKAGLTTTVDNFNSDLTDAINDSRVTPAHKATLIKKLEASKKLKELLDNNFAENISFDSGVGEFSRSIETSIINTNSKKINLNVDENFAIDLGFALNGMGLISTTKGFFNQDLNSEISEEETSTVTINYTLKDNDPINILSVDVVNLFDGYGPIFSTIGGRTSCPYEGPELSFFYNNVDYNADATDILDLPEAKREQLSFATQKAEDPLISVEVASVTNIPESQNAEFVLKLENKSDFTSDAAGFNYFTLIVDNTTNPNNANINISGNGTAVEVPYGEPVFYTLTLGKSVSDMFDYKDIRIVLKSRCDPVNVFSEVFLSAQFTPSCTQVVVDAPLNNWVYNVETAFNLDGTTNPVNIDLSGFNTNFESFKKIDLEYRLAASPTWTRLHTYYGNTTFYDAAVLASETEISLIDSPTLAFSFDIAGLKLQNGNYEIRSRSTCTNDTEFISQVISGRVDLNPPERFGTPLPINGILGVGEDLKVSFSENIFYNAAVSNIEIKGQTNQLPVNHQVSLHFEGTNNTAVISNPKITTGDLTFEFWMKNKTQSGTASIINQIGGLNIGLVNNEISYTIAGVTAKGAIANDNLFHHYTFTYKSSTGGIAIYEEDKEIASNSGNPNLNFTNNNPLVIGGNTFIGNIHDLRLWTKTISLENAFADMYNELIGNETNLIGYWPMNEGRGTIAKDLARFKHAVIKAAWDIKPKGTSYDFTSGQYLTLDNVDFVQLTNEMDATISFWMKTSVSQEATLFSNGKGDGTDIVQTNGFANKWAINLTNSGKLTFESEGNLFALTSQSVVDDTWHHITLFFNRIGSLRAYVDAELVSSNPMTGIGGFSGNKVWVAARGSKDLAGVETVDRVYTGKIDEFRLWNTLRNFEQISRDRFNEVDVESIGLILYSRFNEPDPVTNNGPRYYHAFNNQTKIPSDALLSNGTLKYSNDAPAIKPERQLIKFQVTHVINEDEMILEPVVSDWASLEGQILDITVHRMFDDANNMQQSPITWTAFVKRNEVSWFAGGFNEIVDIVKQNGEEKSFEITLMNKGGKGQPYTIANIPSWLKLSNTSGTIPPDSKVVITATIDKELTAGEYLENLYLQTDFGYDEKMQIKLRVLAKEPDWSINPNDFVYSMNIIGKVKIDRKLSVDKYDKIGAFINGEPVGMAYLTYVETYKEHFAFLNVYSNNIYGESIEFRIWDASQGKILNATIDQQATTLFKDNEVLGSLSNPKLFENTDIVEQNILLNKGWTWMSFNVKDTNFSDLNKLTEKLNLNTDDRIQSHSPAQLEVYYKDTSSPSNSGWSGTLNSLSEFKMYKLNIANEQILNIRGPVVDISNWLFDIKKNWNWLPYPLGRNQSLSEALSNFDALEGDVIKSQNLFAIFDPIVGWNGTLNYLEADKGYMIKSASDQTFKYPSYLNNAPQFKTNTVNKNANNLVEQDKILPQFMRFSENMNAVVLLPQEMDVLYVFDTNGIIRGKSYKKIVNNKELSFITIYGDKPELLLFYIGDNFNKNPTEITFSFKANNVLGTMANPIVLDNGTDEINIFPNPYENDLNVRVNINDDQKLTLKLYSLTGRLVFVKTKKLSKGVHLISIEPKVSVGVYFLKLKLNGKDVIRKLIRK